MGLDDVIKEITHETESIVNTKTLIGEPTTWEGKTIMPIMKVSAGFGSAGGENHQGNGGMEGYAGGGYAGVNMEPIGFVVITEEDVRMLTLTGKSSFSSIIDMIPELAARLPQAAVTVRDTGGQMAHDVSKKIKERRERRAQEGKGSMTDMVREGAEKVSRRVKGMQPQEGSMAAKVKEGVEEMSGTAGDVGESTESHSESQSNRLFEEKGGF